MHRQRPTRGQQAHRHPAHLDTVTSLLCPTKSAARLPRCAPPAPPFGLLHPGTIRSPSSHSPPTPPPAGLARPSAFSVPCPSRPSFFAPFRRGALPVRPLIPQHDGHRDNVLAVPFERLPTVPPLSFPPIRVRGKAFSVVTKRRASASLISRSCAARSSPIAVSSRVPPSSIACRRRPATLGYMPVLS